MSTKIARSTVQVYQPIHERMSAAAKLLEMGTGDAFHEACEFWLERQSHRFEGAADELLKKVSGTPVARAKR